MPWIDTVSPQDASGALKEIYDRQIEDTGYVFPTTELVSLKPRYAALWD